MVGASAGNTELYWDKAEGVHTAYTRWTVSKRSVSAVFFATIRPAYGCEGIHESSYGFVVTRQEFGDLREFADLADAKLYVESLYALERES